MSRRPHRDYTARAAVPASFAGIDVTTPVAGYFRFRLVSGGVRGGVRIWHGPPRDPVTGEEMDRSWRWQAEFDGQPIDLYRVWPACTGEPITEQDYRVLCSRAEWARQNAPRSAFADPKRRLDPLSSDTPLPF